MININLIAERRSRKVREMTILRMSIIGVLLVALAMGLLNFVAYVEHVSAKKQLEQVTAELVEVQEKKEAYDNIVSKIKEREPVVALLKQVQMSEAAWMIILADFPRVMPDDVSIAGITSSMSDKGVEIGVSGIASDEETVGTFMIAIREKTRWAQTATTGAITAEGDTPGSGVRFSLTIPVRGLFGGEIK